MTNEELGKEKAIVMAHSKYTQAVEIIAQIKSLKAQIVAKEKELSGLDVYGQQAVMDDQMARLNVLIERAATA